MSHYLHADIPKRCIGTCSECGGRVVTPAYWSSISLPSVECESCNAIEAAHGPVIPMKPRPVTPTE